MSKLNLGSAPRLEETKRIGRVLRIVQLVSAQPRRWTRRAFAARFEVSERMIDKDLELIRNALCYDLQRAREGYYFVRGPLLKPIELTIPEALALALAAQQARHTGTADPSVIGGALARLEQALPSGVLPYVRRADSGAPSPFGPVHDRAPTLAALEQAMAEGRKVRVTYATASRNGALTERVIAPYYLQPYERSWIVVAKDSLRGDVRMFKVDRIERTELTDDRYTIPEDFDPVAYLGPAWGVLRGESGPAEDVELRFSPLAAPWVRDDRYHPSQEIETLPDGGLVMRFHCGVTHELVRWVLSYGAEVTVGEPGELQEAVLAEAARVVGRGSQTT